MSAEGPGARVSSSAVGAGQLAAALADAERAARRAHIGVVELVTAEQAQAATRLLAHVWNGDPDAAPPVEANLIIALAHAGSCCLGAYRGDELVGVALGFCGPPAGATLHSHIAGVHPALAGAGVGSALKLAQRSWCLERGITVMEWTFDPLIRRNARFNLHRLGAVITEYLPEFYGQMVDGRNAGQGSDRALVRWDLLAPSGGRFAVVDDPLMLMSPDLDLGPVLHEAEIDDGCVLGVRVPEDIESLRSTSPEAARAWRVALREVLHPLLGSGWRVEGIDDAGTYQLRKA